jgi:ankyrin repeat protein
MYQQVVSLPECSLTLTEYSLTLTERSLNLTECSLKLSECSLQCDGWTPLHSAILLGHSEVASALAASGADVNAQSRVCLSPSESNYTHAATK